MAAVPYHRLCPLPPPSLRSWRRYLPPLRGGLSRTCPTSWGGLSRTCPLRGGLSRTCPTSWGTIAYLPYLWGDYRDGSLLAAKVPQTVRGEGGSAGWVAVVAIAHRRHDRDLRPLSLALFSVDSESLERSEGVSMTTPGTTLELRFAEAMGSFFESGGMPRMAGRVWAILLVTDSPHMSAAELQEAVPASAGSISSATRLLLNLGLIERVPVRGERRDYFAPRRGAVYDIIRMRLRQLTAVEDLISVALEQFGDRPHARDHLDEIHDVYHWYAREFPKLHERFLTEQRERASKETTS